jgi:hypothetical protein
VALTAHRKYQCRVINYQLTLSYLAWQNNGHESINIYVGSGSPLILGDCAALRRDSATFSICDSWPAMKNCSYCGRENTDDAAHCQECGTGFKAEVVQASSPRANGLSTKPQNIWMTIRGILGALVLGLVGLGMLGQSLFAVLFGMFASLAISAGGIVVTWLLTRRVRVRRLGIFLRAFACAVFFLPFIPHRSVEWSSPWPPAGFWVVGGLSQGSLDVFETVSILAATLVIGLAGIGFHQYRHGHDTA